MSKLILASCSCIICFKVFTSSQALHKHSCYSKVVKHTQKYILRCSCTHCKKEITVQSLSQHIKSHNNKTKFCLECGLTIHHLNKFCNRSCAARFNNSNRRPETILKQKESINKFYSTLHKKHIEPKPPKNRICIKCGLVEQTTRRFQSEYCKFCNPSLIYRDACKFTFDLRKYPNEFDLSLLRIHGMFHPKHNPKGVSRDHLISVNYGKTHRIDPKILSHPANCQLLTQSANSKKQDNSSLSLPELIDKISIWNYKYNIT